MLFSILKPPQYHGRGELIRHCVIHSVISASPSFAMAILFGWTHLSQIVGMVLGVALFIATAVIIHLQRPLALIMQGSWSARALHWCKLIRVLHALLLWPALVLGKGLYGIITPDLMAGIAANWVTDALGFVPAGAWMNNQAQGSSIALFAQATAATYIEGIILALALAVLTAIFWVVLRAVRWMQQ